MSDALEAALRTWPQQGVPARPDAWLLTAAKRRVIDVVRKDETRARAADRLRLEAKEAAEFPFRNELPDRRLELLLLCAHPEIPKDVRTPLMLQSILGLSAERIASAFLVSPKAMGQRLVRAKRKILKLGLSMELPQPEVLAQRLPHTLEAIYAAYSCGWDGGIDARAVGLSQEALWLVRLVVHRFTEQAEALGLLALISFAESRRDARRGPQGEFVPLEAQDPKLWDHALILEGEKALWIASKLEVPGRYQLEAAIQSYHAHRARSGQTDWNGINYMYALLVQQYPSVGAHIGFAASFGKLGQHDRGLEELSKLEPKTVESHQPFWAVKAYLLEAKGALEASRKARRQAIGLTQDPAVRRWLLDQL